jgi:hypothetical protein
VRLEGMTDVSEVLRCGVYALCYRGAVVYVGKSKAMLGRVYTHKSAWGQKKPRWLTVSAKGMLFDEVHVLPCREDQLDELERALINRYKPKNNILLKTPEPIREEVKLTVNGINLSLNGVAQSPPQVVRRI